MNGLDAAVEVLTDIRTANAGTVGLVIASPLARNRQSSPGAPRPPRRPNLRLPVPAPTRHRPAPTSPTATRAPPFPSARGGRLTW